jgi:hypothetical protein
MVYMYVNIVYDYSNIIDSILLLIFFLDIRLNFTKFDFD